MLEVEEQPSLKKADEPKEKFRIAPQNDGDELRSGPNQINSEEDMDEAQVRISEEDDIPPEEEKEIPPFHRKEIVKMEKPLSQKVDWFKVDIDT